MSGAPSGPLQRCPTSEDRPVLSLDAQSVVELAIDELAVRVLGGFRATRRHSRYGALVPP